MSNMHSLILKCLMALQSFLVKAIIAWQEQAMKYAGTSDQLTSNKFKTKIVLDEQLVSALSMFALFLIQTWFCQGKLCQGKLLKHISM